MVPLDALSLMGGDELSRRRAEERERGSVAADDRRAHHQGGCRCRRPPARADSYLWPPPRAAAHVQVSPRLLRAARSALAARYCSSLRTIAAPSTIAFILPNATSRGRYFSPQSGATTIFSAGT